MYVLSYQQLKLVPVKKTYTSSKNLYQLKKKTWTGTNPNCNKGQIKLKPMDYLVFYSFIGGCWPKA